MSPSGAGLGDFPEDLNSARTTSPNALVEAPDLEEELLGDQSVMVEAIQWTNPPAAEPLLNSDLMGFIVI